MSSTIGNLFKVSIFGESHGRYIGITIFGVPSGYSLDFDFIEKMLERRRGMNELSTLRREKDQYQIISGYFNNKTTGSPLTFIIENKDIEDKVYDDIKNVLRPGHADYASFLKYRGYQDYRGGGHFSGRLTTCMVIAGSIALLLLKEKGIEIGSRVKQIYDISDKDQSIENISEIISKLNNQEFPTFSVDQKAKMIEKIQEIRKSQDSIGGIIETYVNVNNHIFGDPIFNSIEAKISSYLFAIGGVKGISFGKGFEFANLKGSQANDQYVVKEGVITQLSNNNGGINGGITSTLPLIIKTVIKPTSSISKTQSSVNIDTLENIELSIKGRHDPCIVPRALYVINSLVALALIDMIYEEYGKRYFVKD